MTNKAIALSALLLTLSQRVHAQLQAGELNTNLNGTISAGYTADYGNLTGSDHGVTAGGAATLSGSYYDPNLFSFNILPYLNQSRANSDFQSITNSSGVNASAAFFSGSNFPGSISYSKAFNSQGTVGIPDIANFTSHGNSDVFGIGWAERVPNLPSLSVSYQQGNNDYSIYGANTNSAAHFNSLVATTSYLLAGFNLNGSYHYTSTQSQLPQIFLNQSEQKANSDTTSYSFGVGHSLPLRGSFSAGATRSDISLDSTSGNYSGVLDNAYAGVTFNPFDRFFFGTSAQYLDNLTGQFYQSILTTGGVASEDISRQSSHTLDLTSFAGYEAPVLHTIFNVTEEHREQRFEGFPLSSDSVTGTATYANYLFGGMLNATAGVVRTSISPTDQTRVGFLGSVNHTRQIRRWTLSGLVNYAQSQQTLLVSYTSSNFGYSGSVSRRFGRKSSWTTIGSGSKTGLAQLPGSGSYSQNYATNVFFRVISASASYSRASGNSILTNTGLVATPTPLPFLNPTSVILYGGRAYSFGVGANPIRGLTISGTYSKALSTTQSGPANSDNKTELVSARIVYLVRKLYLQAGYTRLVQGFSETGNPASRVTSLYIGVSRWFSFF